MKTVAGIRRSIFYVFETLALATFVLMLGSSVLQVFFRYVLNMPLMWTEELARLMAVLTTFFGSVVVLIAREHIRQLLYYLKASGIHLGLVLNFGPVATFKRVAL